MSPERIQNTESLLSMNNTEICEGKGEGANSI